MEEEEETLESQIVVFAQSWKGKLGPNSQTSNVPEKAKTTPISSQQSGWHEKKNFLKDDPSVSVAP